MKKLFYISALLLSCLLLYSCDTNGNSLETTVAEQTVTAEETTVAEETTDSFISTVPEETTIEETTIFETESITEETFPLTESETTPVKPSVPESILNVFPTADEVITLPIFMKNYTLFDRHLHVVFAEGVPIAAALTELSVDSAHIPSELFIREEDRHIFHVPAIPEGMDEYDYYLHSLFDEVIDTCDSFSDPDIEGIWVPGYIKDDYFIGLKLSIIRDPTDGILKFRGGGELKLFGKFDSFTDLYAGMQMLHDKYYGEETQNSNP